MLQTSKKVSTNFRKTLHRVGGSTIQIASRREGPDIHRVPIIYGSFDGLSCDIEVSEYTPLGGANHGARIGEGASKLPLRT